MKTARQLRMPVSRIRWLLALVMPYAASLAIVVIITLFCRHEPRIKETTVGFTYLLAILCVSTLWELRVAVVMSVAATVAYDYFFLPPVGTLNIADPQDWIALTAFLVTSIIGSHLSTREKRQAERANRHRQEAERLYRFSERLLRTKNPAELLNAIPSDIAELFQTEAVALYVSDKRESFHAGIELPGFHLVRLKAEAMGEDTHGSTAPNVSFVRLRLDAQVKGCLGVSGPALSQATLEALGTLITISIDRVRAMEHLSRMEAARENERLKSALLDAITHDFRTPLTSIKGAVTGLIANKRLDVEQRGELLEIVDQECDRINQLVSEILEMARLDSGNVKLDLAAHSVSDVVSAAIAERKNLLSVRHVHLETRDDQELVHVDVSLSTKVLIHLIDNANLYSPANLPITIRTRKEDGFALFSVADEGPGIEESEIKLIFEKFYRGKAHRFLGSGTGMGLSIAKAIVEAHGGTISVESSTRQGTIFQFRIPLCEEQDFSIEQGRASSK